MDMTWDEFVSNVQQWAAERGIYEHSTPDAQLLKALSEVGELADAYAKQDTAGVIDGIGDVLVCLVNYQTMVGGGMEPPVSGEARIGPWTGGAERAIGQMAVSIGAYIGEEDNKELLPFLATGMIVFSDYYMKVNITQCLQTAWDAIKDRKGQMVEGGVFVKEEASAEQRLAELKDEMARLEEQMEAIGAGGVTRGQRLMNRRE